MARAMPFNKLAAAIYGVPAYQLALPTDAPTNLFDALLTVPGGSKTLLQEEIRKQFGLVPSREMRDGDVLVVKVKTPGAPGLKISEHQGANAGGGGGGGFRSGSRMVGSRVRATSGEFTAQHQSVTNLLLNLQGHFDLPLYDETGLTDFYDVSLKWQAPADSASERDTIQAAILEQLGLELTPSRAQIEMLVLHKEQ